jgi:lysophospholipase L1-like esterase
MAIPPSPMTAADIAAVGYVPPAGAALKAAMDASGVVDPVARKEQRLPIAQWARSFRNLADVPSVMIAPPMLSISAPAAVSVIGGSSSACNVPIGDPRLTVTGTTQTTATAGASFLQPTNNQRGWKVRFLLTGRRFDVLMVNFSGRGLSVYIDGQLVSDEPSTGTNPWSALNNSNRHFALYDFGADAAPSYVAETASLSGGSGHALGDEITLAGGTFTTATVLRVTGVTGGVVSSIAIKSPGSYSVRPAAGPMVQGSTTGTGTGFTYTPTWGRFRTTQKPRRVEIVVASGVYFGGINIDTNTIIAPWPVAGPKFLVAGDSFSADAIQRYAAGNWSEQLAWRLGLHDNFERIAIGGRGYVAGSPLSVDLAAIIARAPDMLLIPLGTNDSASNQISLQATVTANLNALLAALPNVRIVAYTGWTDTGSQSTAIKAGLAAVDDQTRLRLLDIQALGAYSASLQVLLTSSDGLHPDQFGHDALGLSMAGPTAAAFLNMAST